MNGQDWSVYIETDLASIPEEQFDTVTEELEIHHGTTGEAENGNLFARVTVEAETSHGALSYAEDAVQHVLRRAGLPAAAIVGFEVMTDAELTRRLAA